MTTPADDLHPLVREFLTFGRNVQMHADTFEAALAANHVAPERAVGLVQVIHAQVGAVLERARNEGDPSQAVGDAVLASILFGAWLARKGLL